MVMTMKRIFAHFLMPPWMVRQVFPAPALRAIEAAIRDCEATHDGELRFAVEAALRPLALWHKQTARDRAIEVFSELRVWDTARNNGVLIYLLLADRNVEIVADRGIDPLVGQDAWEIISQEMEAAFRREDYLGGVLAGIRAIGTQLAHHYPACGTSSNELPDKPVLL
jgi:uncharacterized membrane protein